MTKNIRPDFELFAEDELAASVSEATAASDSFASAVGDAIELKLLLDELVRLRKVAGLTQSQIATLMGVRQPTVSQFETESSDPRLSTLQRYARAIGCQVSMCVINGDGVFTPRRSYRAVETQDKHELLIEVRPKSQARAWQADTKRRSNYDLVH